MPRKASQLKSTSRRIKPVVTLTAAVANSLGEFTAIKSTIPLWALVLSTLE